MKIIVELDVADEAIYRGWDGKLDEFMASLDARLEEVYDDHGAMPRRVRATMLDTSRAGDKGILDALIRIPEGREPRLPYRGETQLPEVPAAFQGNESGVPYDFGVGRDGTVHDFRQLPRPTERDLEHARDVLTMAADGIPSDTWNTDSRVQRAVTTLGWTTEQAREWVYSETRDK